MRFIVKMVLLACAFFCAVPAAGARASLLRFDKLSVDDGLSQAHVLCMMQDSKGFIWIGNYEGLNRYDGSTVRVFKHKLDDPDSLSDHNVRALLEDSSGAIWVGTKTGGVNLYDRKSGRFSHLRHDPADPDSLSGDSVRALFEDSKGTVWVGTFNGLNRYDSETGSFSHYKHNPSDPSSLSSGEVRVIYEDLEHNLWVGTEHGLNRLDAETGTFTHYRQNPGNAAELRNDLILSLFSEKPGKLWVGTEEGGLHLLDVASGTFTRFMDPIEVDAMYKDRRGAFWVGTENGLARRTGAPGNWDFEFFTHNAYDPTSLSNNEVRVIFEDHSGVLWVGTYGDGACRLTPKVQDFDLYRHEAWNENSLSGRVVYSVWGDEKDIWAGNLSHGLNRINRATGRITHFSLEDGNFPSDKINCIHGDSKGQLWVGTQDAGLVVVDRETGKVIRSYRHDPADPNSLSMDNVWYLLEDSRGQLWVGTSKRGLNLLDRNAGTFTRFMNRENDPHSLSHDRVRNIFEDRDGNIWVGTNLGLNLMDRDTGTFIHWEHDPENPESLSNNRVTPIVQTGDGTIWVGTDKGLNRFNSKNGTFKRYTVDDGLENDAIQGMVVDDSGMLWASTYKGIFRFDPGNDSFRFFDAKDGLQGNEFWMNSYARLPGGELAFGGTRGLTVFNPTSIEINTQPPPVVITGFKVMGESAALPENIVETKNLSISYKDRFFSFSFAALDYTNPEENRFQYMLVGFDKQWVNAEGSHTATYTNFDHGHYVFRVRAANSDGVWNEEGASVRLDIQPPFWKTWVFRISMILLIFLMGYLFYRYRVRFIESQRRELEEQVENRTEELQEEAERHKQTAQELKLAKESAEEANASKSVFLSTMSHEIRTPLNAIIGTSDLLSETEMSSQQMRYVELLQSSGETLLAIINDILDFSKIEAGQIELEHIRFQLGDEVEGAVLTLGSQANNKNLELVCRTTPDTPRAVMGDPTRLRQVLLNLISNAVKFTDSGEVVITVQPAEENDMIHFSVRDTGCGIKPENMESIFDPFLQADSSTTRRFGGTGLGLAICRKLVDLMQGRIWVESEPGKGSSFNFTARMAPAASLVARSAPDLSGMSVLVVDDNESSLENLSEILVAWGADVHRATDAQSARSLLQKHDVSRYSLMVVDQKMPDGDGHRAVQKFEDEFGVLPPVVLLTHEYVDCLSRFGNVRPIRSCCQKPFRRKDLSRAVLEALGIDSAGDNGRKAKESMLASGRILLAEDNPSNREIVRLYLMNSNVRLDMAENGRQAVEMFAETAYDLVIMDMEMPVMDGYEATAKIRDLEKERELEKTPVVALTAHSYSEHRDRCFEAGCDEYVVKPVKKETLLDSLIRLMGKVKHGEKAEFRETVALTFKDLIAPFMDHTRGDLEQLEQALEQADFDAVRKLGHKIGGAAYGFDLRGLGRMCKEIELLASAGDSVSLRDRLEDVYRYLDTVDVQFEDRAV